LRELIAGRQAETVLTSSNALDGRAVDSVEGDAKTLRSVVSTTDGKADSAALLAPIGASAAADLASGPFSLLAIAIGLVTAPLLIIPAAFPALTPIVGPFILFAPIFLVIATAPLWAPLALISNFIYGLGGGLVAPAVLPFDVPLEAMSEEVPVAEAALSSDHQVSRFSTATTEMTVDAEVASVDEAVEMDFSTAVSSPDAELVTSTQPIAETEQVTSSEAIAEGEQIYSASSWDEASDTREDDDASGQLTESDDASESSTDGSASESTTTRAERSDDGEAASGTSSTATPSVRSSSTEGESSGGNSSDGGGGESE
jgi:hypothetical protein